MTPLNLRVNGVEVHTPVAPGALLVDVLRGPLGLTGTHVGCDTAQCGACTVLVDERPVRSCSVLALQMRDREVVTVEGLPALAPGPEARAPGPENAKALHPLQEAFITCHGLQCGFCTPGVLMAAAGLLAHNPNPSEDEVVQALEGNLCRCTGYVNIVQAVLQAATAMRAVRA